MKKETLTRPAVVTLLACLCCLLWGSAVPFINLGYQLFAIPEGETVRQRLQALGAKQSLADLGVPEEKLPELLRISPLIRNRLTLMRTRRMLDL